jgi:glucokinase
MFIGIEIGGTKLQVGLGEGDGVLRGLWRETVVPGAGPEGIRSQIQRAVPELLDTAQVARSQLAGVGIGFGGPVDDTTSTIIKSHQIAGWDNFPLAAWIREIAGLPAVLGNDADVAGLAEALFGAGKGLSPIFYITIGSGIGGGLIVDGEIYRGCGRGAAEVGHLRVRHGYGSQFVPLEELASGWGLQERARWFMQFDNGNFADVLIPLAAGREITVPLIVEAADKGDPGCRVILQEAREALAEAICHVITLVCPRRIIIGGGVSLLGEAILLEPLRQLVAEKVFKPFASCYQIVAAALGEEVVVHGALALARRAAEATVLEISGPP